MSHPHLVRASGSIPAVIPCPGFWYCWNTWDFGKWSRSWNTPVGISLIKEVQQMALAGLISHPWGRVLTKASSQVPTLSHWNSQSPMMAGGIFPLK